MSVQEVFTVFYAIAWGTAANAQPRWKAFDYTTRSVGWLRIFLSWVLLNILPIASYLCVLRLFRSNSLPSLLSILPALMPFGF